MAEREFKDKFVAFIDILGFRGMVEAAEAGADVSADKLQEYCGYLGTKEDYDNMKTYGPTICPYSTRIDQDLDFQLTQISDCAIISTEISPSGVINLVWHCYHSAINLLREGMMIRGYLTLGPVIHDERTIMGSAYQRAFDSERNVSAFREEADERGTPFIEIDREISQYVQENTDECVRKMFSRMTKGDDTVTAIFPFKALTHKFIIDGLGGDFDPEKEKNANQNLRVMLTTFKSRIMSRVDHSNPGAMKKARHYVRALDEQIQMCDKTDEMIDLLSSPYPQGDARHT